MPLSDVFYSGLYPVAVVYDVRPIGKLPSLRAPIVNCSEALSDDSGYGLMLTNSLEQPEISPPELGPRIFRGGFTSFHGPTVLHMNLADYDFWLPFLIFPNASACL